MANFDVAKGYPHSLIRLAYFRTQLFSPKTKSERVVFLFRPGSVMFCTVFVAVRSVVSCWLPTLPSALGSALVSGMNVDILKRNATEQFQETKTTTSACNSY